MTSAATPRATGPIAGGAPIIPMVTIDDATRTQRLVESLIAGGIGCVEIALRTPDAMRLIAAASALPNFVVGAGTVLSADDVDRVVDADATFVVSLGLDDEVVARCLDLGVQVIPGVATATEIQRALRWGLDHLKLFPASTVGGVAAIEQFAGPVPRRAFPAQRGRQRQQRQRVCRVGFGFRGQRQLDGHARDDCRFGLSRDHPTQPRSSSPGGPVKSGVLTMGEGLGIIRSRDVGSLVKASEMVLGTGGDEANVAIGLARLGAAASWLGRVGDDPIGVRVTRELRAEGVKVVARVDPDASTGVIIKSTPSVGRTHVMNYRKGSAGSRLEVNDLDLVDVSRYQVVHVTGITPALSASAVAAVTELMTRAHRAGALVSVDVNHRSKLWADPDEAIRSHLALVVDADIVFAGQDEAALLVGSASDPADLAHRLNALGPDEVVITMGDHGALTLSDDVVTRCEAHLVTVVDTVGVGDAFVAGYLSELLAEESIEHCLLTATRAGALACTHPGDWEGAPTHVSSHYTRTR